MFDPYQARRDFPILHRSGTEGPLIYLDNAATTQKPKAVLDALMEQYTVYNGNVHRGTHWLSNRSTERYEWARRTVRNFIHADSEKEIIFTRGTTESINLAAQGMARAFLKPGDEVVVTLLEHHSNLLPWQAICKQTGAMLRVISFDQNGDLDLQQYHEMVKRPQARIATFCHVSNVHGTCNPIREMIAAAHQNHVLTLVDGAQAVSHMAVDVRELGCDFYAFSGHKVYGPNGIGVLYGKQELLKKMPPYQLGGEMVDRVTPEDASYTEIPLKFEAGTPNYPGAIALAAALRYLNALGLSEIERHETALLAYAKKRLAQMPGVQLYGQPRKAAGCISFGVEGIHHYDLALLLDQFHIAVRSGTHCAQPALRHMQVTGTVRASLALYNTREDIDELCDKINQAILFLKGKR